jgi:hypothetical protein
MSEDNHKEKKKTGRRQYDAAQEINFEGDEEPEAEFRFHLLDAAAHHAGYGPHPGRKKLHHHIREHEDQLDRPVPTEVDLRRLRDEMEYPEADRNQENLQERNEETRTKKAGTKPGESFEAWCARLGIRMNKRVGGVEFAPYHGGNLLPRKPKRSSNDGDRDF